MKDEERLRIELSVEELRRIEDVARARGLDPKDWARDVLLQELGRREGSKASEEY